MAKLLVSVRSVEEARAALAGGADLIDVKEPSRGPLGKADDAVIAAVVAEVAGRVPVSAAMGEWAERGDGTPSEGVAFVKWGLCGLRGRFGTSPDLTPLRQAAVAPVLVAYADCMKAGSPDPYRLAYVAIEHRFAAFLIDTFDKTASTLLDWWPVDDLSWLIGVCQRGGVPVALAGSLDAERIEGMLHLRPDWFAVRGAACDGGREGAVSADRVRELKTLISRPSNASDHVES